VTGLEQAVVMNVEVENALRQELAMTRQYLDLAGVILIALNPQGEITLINAKGCDVLGWEKEALLGQNWFDMCLPHEDRARVRDVFQQLVAGVIEPVEFFENPVLTRSGEQRLIAWRNAVLTNGSGHIVGILSSGEDITEHRQAREALRESTERYQSLFNRVPIGLYKTTHEGQIVDANPALVDMLGYPDRESLLMTRVQDLFVNLEDRQTEQEQLEQEDIIQCFQMQLRRYDGTIVWVEDNVRSILNGDGRAYYEGSLTDITNRKQAELALLESETRFRSVAQAAPDAIITADNQGHIVFWNEAAEDMFGYETDEVIGQSLTRIMPTRYREQHTAGMTRFLATNESTMIGRQVELVGLRHDGREFPLEFTLAAWGVGDHAFFSAILRDVTDRKRAEEALRRRDALLETLASFSELLLRSTDLDAVLPDALARLGEAARVSRAHIFENHTAPDGALLTTCRYEWVKPSPESPISLLSLQNVAYDDDFARWVGLLSQGQPLYGLVRDLPARERATLEAQGIVSQATVPIFAGEDWWGFLGFDDCDRERDWLPAEIEALRNIASVFGAALVRQRAEQAERDQRLLAEALRDTATALNSTLDLNEVLDNILSNLERALPHDTASVMIIESSGIARAVRSHGYNEFGIPDSPTDAVYRLRINDLVGLRRMVEDKRPLLFPDVETEAEWVHLEDDPTSLRSYLAAPILWNGDVIGFLTLRSVTPGFFTPEDTPRLQAFADQVATALHNAQLFAAERDQRLLAETLTETASVLTSALDVTTVLDRILESVERVVPHDAANIMLLDGTIIRNRAKPFSANTALPWMHLIYARCSRQGSQFSSPIRPVFPAGSGDLTPPGFVHMPLRLSWCKARWLDS
jgi:PAS domain S-box-containing protein